MSEAPAGTPPGLRVVQARRAAAAPLHVWRRSLQVRMVTVSVVLSALALALVGTYLSATIRQGLFNDRLQQVLAESARATTDAQSVLVGASADDVESAVAEALEPLESAAAGRWGYAMTRSQGDLVSTLPDRYLPEEAQALVSPELLAAVAQPDSGQQWQSVAVPAGREDGSVPGIVVGQSLTVPGAAEPYELYLIYDLSDVQTTLDFVQRTVALAAIALVLLIGVITLIVVRLVVVPIREAASVSEQLASGDLARRIPERGEDVLATLARSFNRMAESLQRQITQLGNLSRVQQRFVSDVSHELRTPLTTIRLASDVLYNERRSFEPYTARSAELLRDQVARFETLLADLLEISRMDAQAAEVQGTPTSLVDVARDAIAAVQGLADDLGTSVHLIAPGGHVEIEVDDRRIARVVRNLLSNAIEHGERRPVVVTVDSSETAVAIGVRDHGAGMTDEHTQRVFDRFWRADPSRQRRVGGTGLGLAISLEDAQLHGGTLEVWSRPGDGANFVLTLPRTPGVPAGPSPIALVPRDAKPEPPADPVPPEPSGARRARVRA